MQAPRTVDEELEQLRAAIAASLVVTDSVPEGAAASGTSGTAAGSSSQAGAGSADGPEWFHLDSGSSGGHLTVLPEEESGSSGNATVLPEEEEQGVSSLPAPAPAPAPDLQPGGEPEPETAPQAAGYVSPSASASYSARARAAADLAAGSADPEPSCSASCAGSSSDRPDAPGPAGPTWGIAPERLERAKKAGYWGAQKAAGIVEKVPPTPSVPGLPPTKRCFVLLVGRDARISGYFAGPYAQFRGYVENPATRTLAPHVVFHGFASQTEARAYWEGAGRAQPWRLLPPMA